VGLATACSQDAGVADVLVVSQVEVTPSSSAIVVGQNLQLAATPKTEGGIPLPARDVVWSSSNIKTATVTSEGLVHAESVGGPVKIRATVEGVTGETDITVVAFPIDHIVVTPEAASVTVGQTTQFTATAFDPEGVPLTGRTFLWGSSNPETAAVTSTGLVLGMAAGGPVTISVSAEGKTASGSVTVTARPATRVGFLQQPTTAPAGASIAPAIKVAVQDDLMGTVTTATNNVTLALLTTEGDATLSGTKTVAAVNGVATFSNLTINRTGTSYVLTATATGLNPATSSSFGILPGALARLSFTVAPPGTARSGVAFGDSPVVQLRDAFGNAVTSSGVTVTAAASGGTLGGATVAATSNGAATFTGLSLTGPAGQYTISFTTPGVPSLESGVVALTLATPTTLNLTTQPSASAQSGAAFAVQPVVRLVDAGGSPVPQSGVVVTASIGTGPTGGSLTGTASVATDASGVATFTNLALSGPAGSYQLKFASPTLASATSNPVVLGAGAGAALSVTTQPSSQAVSGTPFAQQPAIQLRDAAGNAVALANVAIGAAIQSGGGILGGTTSATTNAAGLATFTNLSLTGDPGTRTLRFAAIGYGSVTSAAISLASAPPPPGQLELEVEPSKTALVGVPFEEQPVLRVKDGLGNGVSGVAVSVQVTKGEGTLAGVTTVSTNDAGRAVFTGLSLSGKLGKYKLTFTAAPSLTVTTRDIDLKVGPPTQLLITTQPSSSVRTGRNFPTQPVIRLLDAGDNPVSGVAVTASVNACSLGNSVLGGTTVVNTNSQGFAVYSNLKLTGLSLVGCTLKFTAGTLSQISVNIFVGL
jgi:hypothetical protein